MARPTKPGNIERGWNDPPVFLYNTGTPVDPASTTTPRRHPLTKRIAYTETPLSGSVASVGAEGGSNEPPCPPTQTDNNIVSESGLIPPSTTASTGLLEDNFPQVQLFPPSNTTELPQFAAPIIVPTMIHGSVDGVIRPVPVIATNPVSGVHVAASDTTDVLQIPNFDDDEQMFHYVITRLHRAIRDCQTVVEPKVLEDIQKKVNILSDLWKNGKVSYPVKCTMARLSTAIHKRHCAIAQELHLALMIDHVSEVSKWLVGIKRLIQEVERVEQPLSPSSVCFPASDGTPFRSLATQPTESVQIQPTESVQIQPTESVQIQPTESVQIQPTESAEIQSTEPADLVADNKSELPAESHELFVPVATQLTAELDDVNRLAGEQTELPETNKTELDVTDSVRSSLEGSNLGSVVKPTEDLSNDPALSEASVG